MNNSKKVILIYGGSGNGKSYLATQLHDKHGYYPISLDQLYVDFIRDRYPDFYLKLLPRVIGQHYDTMFRQDQNGVDAWCQHVITVTHEALGQNERISVEGYLLAPALTALQESLIGVADVKTVEVRGGQYFVSSNLEELIDN